ncbi:hypothetical protein V6M85_12240 [Sulfolobus tengchongensis]|uniref:Uncharacterized protein n=1 Tax=Sulfolobus tengchongensis TaxID=207809 RepID=A0AAX4L1B2_9CREN
MPKGELMTFDEGDFEGSIDYQSFTKAIKLNNINKEVGFPLDITFRPTKFYLIIQAKREKTYLPRWRLWFDNFSLTKEFKPNFEIEINDSHIISTIVYDITPIVKEGKHEIIIYHPSIHTLELLNVSAISFYKIEGFSTKYKLSTGSLILKPNEIVSFQLMRKSYFVIRNESKEGKVKISDGDGKPIYTVLPNSDSDEIEIEDKSLITTILQSANEKDYGIILASYSLLEKTPKITINVDSKVDNNFIHLALRNDSEINLDKLIVNVMINGVPAHFKSFNNIEINSTIDLKLPLTITQNKKAHIINIRVVGVKGGYRQIVDKQISL